MNKSEKEKSHYIEKLALEIKNAKPYYVDSASKLIGMKTPTNQFPKKPGVYLILRRVQMESGDYTRKGLNTKSPMVLYVGKTFARRNIKDRLKDHFGGKRLNFQGSQFRKFLMQVCQDEEMVKKILWSENTLIVTVPIEEPDEVIDFVENLVIRVFQPRFNIKNR